MSTFQTKLVLSGIALIPYIFTLFVVLLPVYIVDKRSILSAVWKDAMLWIGSLVLFYLATLGSMLLPWPKEWIGDEDGLEEI
jgi:hypothetical protein